MSRCGEEWLDEAWQQSEPLDDDTGLTRERERRSSIIRLKHSPRNQWKVSNIVFGGRVTQRSSTSMVMNLCSSSMLRFPK